MKKIYFNILLGVFFSENRNFQTISDKSILGQIFLRNLKLNNSFVFPVSDFSEP